MASDRHTRRSFLMGEAAVRELTAAAPDATTVAKPLRLPLLSSDHGVLLTSVRRRAMACDFEVQLAAGRDDQSMERIFEALDLLEALEDQMTVYRADSEVIRINQRAGDGPVPVEPRLFSLFQLAARIYRDTDGAFDITSGPLSDAWGFSRRRGRMPADDEIAAAFARVGMADVVLDEAEQTIAFTRAGVTINLNSIGKGYALDRMAELLADDNVDDCLLHGGRSSLLARGDQPGGKSESGWTVGLRHPLRPDERLAEFSLRDQALATSGSGTQSFRHGGKRYGHLLDPRTGRPVEGVYTATAIAPTAAEADALSTAFYVMGPEEAGRYCTAHAEVSALLVCPADDEDGIRVDAFNCDDQMLRQLAQF